MAEQSNPYTPITFSAVLPLKNGIFIVNMPPPRHSLAPVNMGNGNYDLCSSEWTDKLSAPKSCPVTLATLKAELHNLGLSTRGTKVQSTSQLSLFYNFFRRCFGRDWLRQDQTRRTEWLRLTVDQELLTGERW